MEVIAPSIPLTAKRTINQHTLTRTFYVQSSMFNVKNIERRTLNIERGISRLAFTPFAGEVQNQPVPDDTQEPAQIQASIIPAFNAIEPSWATTTKIYKRPPTLRFILGGISLHRIYSVLANPDSNIKLNEKLTPISTYISKAAGVKYSLEGYVLVIRFDRKEATASFLQQRKLVITATTVLEEKVVAEISVPTLKGVSVSMNRVRITVTNTKHGHGKRRRLKRWPRKLIS